MIGTVPTGSTSGISDLVSAMVRFCRLLRKWGIKLPADASHTALRALAEIDISRLDDCRNALLIALLQRPEDRPLFIYLFNVFWVIASRARQGSPADAFPGRPVDQQTLAQERGTADEAGELGGLLRGVGELSRAGIEDA